MQLDYMLPPSHLLVLISLCWVRFIVIVSSLLSIIVLYGVKLVFTLHFGHSSKGWQGHRWSCTCCSSYRRFQDSSWLTWVLGCAKFELDVGKQANVMLIGFKPMKRATVYLVCQLLCSVWTEWIDRPYVCSVGMGLEYGLLWVMHRW